MVTRATKSDLGLGTELVLATGANPTFRLVNTGNLVGKKVPVQVLYSRLKDVYRLNDSTYGFYADPIREISYQAGIWEVVHPWKPFNQATLDFLVDGGLTILNSDGSNAAIYLSLISLGAFDNASTDRAYYQQTVGGAATDAIDPGPLNQLIKVYGDSNNGNIDYRSYLPIFLREAGKTYARYELVSQQNTGTLIGRTYQVPLTNEPDAKVLATDSTIASTAPYTSINITYLSGTGFTAWAAGQSYALNAVVSFGGRWYIATSSHTSSSSNEPTDGGAPWTAYSGERLINTGAGDVYAPFNRIIAGANARTGQIYTKERYLLRQSSDIDSGTGTVTGETADTLLSWDGETLVTASGVWIDNFNADDKNSIRFVDATGTTRTFKFVTTATILADANIRADSNAEYHVWQADNFGTDSAVRVPNPLGSNISGLVSGSAAISIEYDYDGYSGGGHTAGTDLACKLVILGSSAAKNLIVDFTFTKAKGIPIAANTNQERAYV